MATQTVQIRTLYDSYVSKINDFDINYGSRDILEMYSLSGTIHKMGYIKFPTDIIPENAIIKNAKLIANVTEQRNYNTSGDNINDTYIISLYKISSNWDEGTITYNNKPKLELLEQNFLSLTNTTVPYTKEIDITQYWEQIKENGFCLYPYTAIYSKNFVFSFTSNDGNPQLYMEVEYTTDIPQAPQIVNPKSGEVLNKNINTTYKFEWIAYNQTDFEIQYSQDNTNWQSIIQNSTNRYYNFNISSLDYGNFYWKVRIKNNDGIWSSWSATQLVKIGERPSTPITNINISNKEISWNKIDNVISSQIQILKGTEIIEDSNEVYSIANSYNFKTTLENNTQYTFKVRVKNSLNIWSNYASKTVNVSFEEPTRPELLIFEDNEKGKLHIHCIKKTGTITTDYFDVFRKEITGEWQRIAMNVQEDFVDYTLKSNIDYVYKIRAISNLGGFKDSTEVVKQLKLRHSQITVTSDYNNYINLKWNPKRNVNVNRNKADMQFAGRKKSVSEFDEHISKSINLNFTIRNYADKEKLKEILNSGETLLYRDNRSRKIFCTASGVSIEDKQRKTNEYNVSFRLDEVGFEEVI